LTSPSPRWVGSLGGFAGYVLMAVMNEQGLFLGWGILWDGDDTTLRTTGQGYEVAREGIKGWFFLFR